MCLCHDYEVFLHITCFHYLTGYSGKIFICWNSISLPTLEPVQIYLALFIWKIGFHFQKDKNKMKILTLKLASITNKNIIILTCCTGSFKITFFASNLKAAYMLGLSFQQKKIFSPPVTILSTFMYLHQWCCTCFICWC